MSQLSRPRKCRRVCCLPDNVEFFPAKKSEQEPVILNVDEYETLRLIDKECFSQEQCGEYMRIARTTVQQIYASARRKVAEVLVGGLPLRIEGGDYQLCEGNEEYCGCGGCMKHRLFCEKLRNREVSGMKIVMPLDESREDICVSFGRAPFFMFCEDDKTEILENPAADAQGGAGLKAAQFVVDNGATVLITVRCGQNAADVFKAAGMKIYKSEGSSAKENLEACLNGKLAELTHFHEGFHGAR